MRGTGLLTRIWGGRGVIPLSPDEAYRRWAPVYPPHAHNPVMAAEASIVGTLLRDLAPRRALDVGTGTGRNLITLQQCGVPTVIGIDLSAAMLLRTDTAFRRVRGNATQLPFRSRCFDLVSASLMCGDLPDLAPWIAEASRVLADGGHLVYSDFHPSWAHAGWRRTFSGADGRQYELPLHHHGIEEQLALLDDSGMQVRAIREPRVAGGRTPVVVVFHAIKAHRARR